MNWFKYRLVYFLISFSLIGVGLFSLLNWGLKLGVDFKGGSLLEYRVEKEFSTEEATARIEKQGIKVTSIQKTGKDAYLLRLITISQEEKDEITAIFTEVSRGEIILLRFETVGPSIGPELIKKTVYAIIIAALLILLWVAYQFKSFKFGTSAILAMLHDSFILIGAFSVMGPFLGGEFDFLFVTALLTTLSFSVHDTIVVYDRIRESQRKAGGDLVTLANQAVSQTMVRSLNNSFTIIFMLTALILLGGTTIKWFAVALFIGTVLGTYSSPFVAVPILVVWDEAMKKFK